MHTLISIQCEIKINHSAYCNLMAVGLFPVRRWDFFSTQAKDDKETVSSCADHNELHVEPAS